MAYKLYLIGGGGHCNACIDVIEASKSNEYEIVGVIDSAEKLGEKVLDYSIIATDNNIKEYVENNAYFLITVGQIKSSTVREKLYDKLISLNANIATIISPYAIVSKYSTIEKGTIIMHGSIIGPNVQIGNNCIINTGADIEHDSLIKSHSHISTNAVINGDCKIGSKVFVGSNATVFQGITVEDGVIISAGSIVKRNILEEGVYINNECIKNG